MCRDAPSPAGGGHAVSDASRRFKLGYAFRHPNQTSTSCDRPVYARPTNKQQNEGAQALTRSLKVCDHPGSDNVSMIAGSLIATML